MITYQHIIETLPPWVFDNQLYYLTDKTTQKNYMILQIAFGLYACFIITYLFLLTPLSYFILVRRFDKQFKIKYYTVEKGLPGSFIIRLYYYSQSIVLHSYQNEYKKSSLLAKYANKHFTYLSRIYGCQIDFRKHATTVQVILAYLFIYGTVLVFTGVISIIIHDFMLFPNEPLGGR